MFEQLERLLNNIKKANTTQAQNQLSISVFRVPEISRFIIRLNQVDQLYTEGLDVNDKIIGTYSYLTALKAGEEHYIFNGLVSVKKVGEPYTLYETGEFYESFKVVIDSAGFIITANTVKEDKDLMDYGEILGLNAESKSKLSKKMLPFLQQALREYFLNNIH